MSIEADAVEFHRTLSGMLRILQFRDRDRICCYGVSITQSQAMAALAERGPMSLNDVAAELYVDKSTASRSIKALEEKGYIRRRSDAADARALLLDLAPAGRRIHQKIVADCLAEETRLLSPFDAPARRAIIEFVRRLSGAVGSGVSAGRGACCRVEA